MCSPGRAACTAFRAKTKRVMKQRRRFPQHIATGGKEAYEREPGAFQRIGRLSSNKTGNNMLCRIVKLQEFNTSILCGFWMFGTSQVSRILVNNVTICANVEMRRSWVGHLQHHRPDVPLPIWRFQRQKTLIQFTWQRDFSLTLNVQTMFQPCFTWGFNVVRSVWFVGACWANYGGYHNLAARDHTNPRPSAPVAAPSCRDRHHLRNIPFGNLTRWKTNYISLWKMLS